MRHKPHVSKKKLHKKKEYETNKNKSLKTAGEMYFSWRIKTVNIKFVLRKSEKQRTVNASY